MLMSGFDFYRLTAYRASLPAFLFALFTFQQF